MVDSVSLGSLSWSWEDIQDLPGQYLNLESLQEPDWDNLTPTLVTLVAVGGVSLVGMTFWKRVKTALGMGSEESSGTGKNEI
ncbi:hypothetical protein SARC_07751 [Sphaeroforma arctica JP610]|uniref:Uncharacterized protein n=1 Tax=Sphaeroforma arctica JP610 TaxID=667725 RepID=A0A0L0FTG1_9EUKA|nr:hypothetical protein SARC_07751 [Sphaeroforma arctica JP610]KNC79866.1 hypothetical protein SARC_07751 [Sphaeroforma arctica JP610]|eukprot:XP_014153768.1 hypothetical protein SARC_07751 [Sphaeroforma arctica JP610]